MTYPEASINRLLTPVIEPKRQREPKHAKGQTTTAASRNKQQQTTIEGLYMSFRLLSYPNKRSTLQPHEKGSNPNGIWLNKVGKWMSFYLSCLHLRPFFFFRPLLCLSATNERRANIPQALKSYLNYSIPKSNGQTPMGWVGVSHVGNVNQLLLAAGMNMLRGLRK
uniref:Uncharacterized protein n=1 Tax=Strigamia maritima TaxID=126957 RepID=T1IQD5_STRMM